MELKKLTVHNYKSLVNFELNEPNAFTVFAGPNGAGKSNIFEALEFLSYCKRVQLPEVEKLFGGKSEFLNFNAEFEEYKISLYFESGSILSITPENYKSQVENVVGNYQIIKESNFISLQDSLSKIPLNQLIDNFLRLFIRKEELMRIRYTVNYDLLPDASNLEPVLNRILKDENIREEFLEWLHLFIPGFKNIQVYIDPVGGTNTLLIYEEGTTKPFTKNLISDGTYNILALLTAVYQTNEPQFLCIEEPENGLNPYVVESLVDFFRKQCQEKGHVIWLNTHSQTLVKYLRPEELILVDKEKGETKIKQFSKDYPLYSLDMDTAWLSNALGGGLPW